MVDRMKQLDAEVEVKPEGEDKEDVRQPVSMSEKVVKKYQHIYVMHTVY